MAAERTLGETPGFPYLPRGATLPALRRAAAGSLALAALVLSVASAAASIGGYPDPGIDTDPGGQIITAVSPAGFAWREGIRPGQPIEFIDTDDNPDHWRIGTIAGSRHLIVKADSYDAALRATLPLCLGAMLVAGLAVLLLRGNRSWSPAASAVALLLATPALVVYGKPDSSTIAMGVTAAIPALWLAWRPRVPLAISALATLLTAMLIGAWAVARLGPLDSIDQLEPAREAWAHWGTVLLVVLAVVVPVVRGAPISVGRPSVGDVVLVGVVGGLALGVVTVFAVPPLVLGIALLIALFLLPAWRRILAPRAERLLLADVRERATIEASEAERAHLARELHDAPLQQLAGVIRRLELLPTARAENDQLRAVAEQLRGMATELRPPVLDDLGLVAAIEFIAERDATDAIGISVHVADETGLVAASRPPAPVELAIFRIAQEAITNAVRHARAGSIKVSGTVAPTRIDLEIADDGRGLVDAEMRSAARRGRLGLASIRRRAEAIEADVTIKGTDRGTRIKVRWGA